MKTTKYNIEAFFELNNDGKDIQYIVNKKYKHKLVVMEERTFNKLIKKYNIKFEGDEE